MTVHRVTNLPPFQDKVASRWPSKSRRESISTPGIYRGERSHVKSAPRVNRANAYPEPPLLRKPMSPTWLQPTPSLWPDAAQYQRRHHQLHRAHAVSHASLATIVSLRPYFPSFPARPGPHRSSCSDTHRVLIATLGRCPPSPSWVVSRTRARSKSLYPPRPHLIASRNSPFVHALYIIPHKMARPPAGRFPPSKRPNRPPSLRGLSGSQAPPFHPR